MKWNETSGTICKSFAKSDRLLSNILKFD